MKRIITMLLALVLLITCMPNLAVSATEADQKTSVQDLHVSESMLKIIKKEEGFSKNYYWDYQQYSIGYGSFAGKTKEEAEKAYPNGITEEEADKLLREKVASDYEKPIKDYAARKNLNLSQIQFDALVSFTYNCGSGWTTGCKVTIWLEKYLGKEMLTPAEELEFVRSIGLWNRAGGSCMPALCRRRINEARIFLYGDYAGNNSRPYYYIIFHAVTSKMSNGYEDMAAFFAGGQPAGTLPEPNPHKQYTFAGWFTATGEEVTANTVISKDMEVYARWKDADGKVVDSKDPGMPSTPETPSVSEPPANQNPVSASDFFDDVKAGSWYEEYVSFVYDEGLFGGTSETMFSPEMTMNRAMLVTVLYRHAGEPAVNGPSSFKDVPKDYYSDAVAWAEEYGIVNGVTSTEFAPKNKITREQIAAILYRYCVKYQGIIPENSASIGQFEDKDRVSGYAVEAMEWAVGNTIINGMSPTTLNPKGNATRAQTAAMLTRAIQEILS